MSNLSKRIITSLVLLFIILFSFSNLILYCLLSFFVSTLAFNEFTLIFKRIFKKSNLLYFFSVLFSIFYVINFLCFTIFFLIDSFQVNKFTIIFLISICISTDIGGFVFGKIIGGKKLTSISPNKTYAGVCGSFVTSILIGFLFYNNWNNILPENINIILFVCFLSLLSQLGDLTISIFKRKAKLKDTGVLLPGHGGILDRVDGILLAVPLGIIIIQVST